MCPYGKEPGRIAAEDALAVGLGKRFELPAYFQCSSRKDSVIVGKVRRPYDGLGAELFCEHRQCRLARMKGKQALFAEILAGPLLQPWNRASHLGRLEM